MDALVLQMIAVALVSSASTAALIAFAVIRTERSASRKLPPQSARLWYDGENVDADEDTVPDMRLPPRDGDDPRALGGTLRSAPWGELWPVRVRGSNR